MSKKAARKAGHPTDYREEYCDKLIYHMGKGYSFESFAAQCDVHRDTLYEWCKKHDKFSDAKKRGRDKSLEFWEKQGIDGLYTQHIINDDGSKSTLSLNTGVWAFNMKNKHGWMDKQEIIAEVTKKDEATQKLDQMYRMLLEAKEL